MKRELTAVQKRPAKLWRGPWGQRTKGNPDALTSSASEFVGKKTLEGEAIHKKAQAMIDDAFASFKSKETA